MRKHIKKLIATLRNLLQEREPEYKTIEATLISSTGLRMDVLRMHLPMTSNIIGIGRWGSPPGPYKTSLVQNQDMDMDLTIAFDPKSDITRLRTSLDKERYRLIFRHGLSWALDAYLVEYLTQEPWQGKDVVKITLRVVSLLIVNNNKTT